MEEPKPFLSPEAAARAKSHHLYGKDEEYTQQVQDRIKVSNWDHLTFPAHAAPLAFEPNAGAAKYVTPEEDEFFNLVVSHKTDPRYGRDKEFTDLVNKTARHIFKKDYNNAK